MVIRPPTRPGVALLAALALAPVCAAARGSTEPRRERVLIGLVPEINLFEQKARFRGLGEYLTRRIGVPVQFTILSRYGNVLERFESDGMDGAFLGSFAGALAIERLGLVPVARMVSADGASTYQGFLFVRKESGISGVEAMRGKRMVYVDRATTAGYLFPRAWLRQRGVAAPERFFAESWFAGSHDAAIAAVLEGKADVGAAKDGVFDRVRREDPRVDRELVVLAASTPVPSTGLFLSSALGQELRDALRRALLALHAEPDGAGVLAQLGALRFIETSAADYATVLELSRQAGHDLALRSPGSE